VLCYAAILRTNIVKNKENQLIVFKNNARKGFLFLASNEKTILGARKEKMNKPVLNITKKIQNVKQRVFGLI
jgi:hypothetical protein